MEVFGGWSAYAMSDFNDSLAATNQFLGTNFKDITSGGAGGIGVRMWPTQQVLLRLDVGVMLAETQNSGVLFDVGPGGVTLSGTYFFQPEGPFRFGLGGGLGTHDIIGTVEGPGGSLETSGSAFDVHGMGEAMLSNSDRWSMSGILGYRDAKASNLKFDNQSSNTEVDFPGVMLRVGLAYDWTKRVPASTP
jgi:hypothetical protein